MRLGPAWRLAITAGVVVFLAWFSMKFYMDNSNDSETDRYVTSLMTSASTGAVATDATGHYTLLAQYVMWSVARAVEFVTPPFPRAYAVAYTLAALLLYATAYAWYRTLGLAWLTSLVGLLLLSVCAAFALLIRGWELDKLIEPGVYLVAATLAWSQRFVAVVGLAAAAVVNRETGVFLPLVALAGLAAHGHRLVAALARWPVWSTVLVCAAGLVFLRAMTSDAARPPINAVLAENLRPDHLVYVIGGLCWVPLLSVAWLRSAAWSVQRLFYLVAPAWVAYVFATDRLEQGAILLTPVALLCVPITLLGVERLLRSSPLPRSASDA